MDDKTINSGIFGEAVQRSLENWKRAFRATSPHDPNELLKPTEEELRIFGLNVSPAKDHQGSVSSKKVLKSADDDDEPQPKKYKLRKRKNVDWNFAFWRGKKGKKAGGIDDRETLDPALLGDFEADQEYLDCYKLLKKQDGEKELLEKQKQKNQGRLPKKTRTKKAPPKEMPKKSEKKKCGKTRKHARK